MQKFDCWFEDLRAGFKKVKSPEHFESAFHIRLSLLAIGH